MPIAISGFLQKDANIKVAPHWTRAGSKLLHHVVTAHIPLEIIQIRPTLVQTQEARLGIALDFVALGKVAYEDDPLTQTASRGL